MPNLSHRSAQLLYHLLRAVKRFTMWGRHGGILLAFLLVSFSPAAGSTHVPSASPSRQLVSHFSLMADYNHSGRQDHTFSTVSQEKTLRGDMISTGFVQETFPDAGSKTGMQKLPSLPAHLWRRDWVLLVFLMVVVLMIAGLRSLELSRIRLRDQIRQADFEAAKLKELNQLKSRFFTNISHEFRTPLTLIKGPVEQLMTNTGDPSVRKALQGIHNNAGRLLNLINQLLDLARLENGQYTLKAAPGNISSFIKGQVYSFLSLTEQKGIRLNYREDTSRTKQHLTESIFFDSEVLQHIITNLLSNAVKFTSENGRIDVLLTLKNDTVRGIMTEITVEDTGIGIDQVHLPYIFDRFYQVDDNPLVPGEGSGIGLAFVRELVELHKGGISVESKPGQGTRFRVILPGSKPQYAEGETVPQVNNMLLDGPAYDEPPFIPENLPPEPDSHSVETNQKPLILVVEDHYEVRQFIIQSLGDAYQVIDAPTARKGLELALEFIPDLVLSDVMMPGMDGLTFCSKIKGNEKTSHIPLIFLTARSNDEDMMCGLETGADGYLTKPFSPRELEIRVRNLIESRKIMREKFDRIVLSPGEIVVSSRDEQFMEKVLQIVEEHISREDFMVEDLASKAGMSQSQLQRKLKALINQSPNQLIRSIRLQRAKELITQNAGTISEISYMVGYGDPGYFTKSYKNHFGVLPSDDKSN